MDLLYCNPPFIGLSFINGILLFPNKNVITLFLSLKIKIKMWKTVTELSHMNKCRVYLQDEERERKEFGPLMEPYLSSFLDVLFASHSFCFVLVHYACLSLYWPQASVCVQVLFVLNFWFPLLDESFDAICIILCSLFTTMV